MSDRLYFPKERIFFIVGDVSIQDGNVNAAFKRYAKKSNAKQQREIELNGKRYHEINVTYRISKVHRHKPNTDLVDRGANGGIAGSNLRIIETTGDILDVEGIDKHQVTNIPIVTAGGVTKTNKGPVIAIFHQYAQMPTSKTIHSSGQIEYCKNEVDDRAKVNGGLRRNTAMDGYFIPMSFRNGLLSSPCGHTQTRNLTTFLMLS
jgi:hypothetical protein